MKFKVGDKVKIIKIIDDDGDMYQKDKGKIGKITDIDNNHTHPYSLDCKGLMADFFLENELELVKKSKPAKPPKFLLQYELDEDPIEYFEMLPQARNRLKELVKDETLKRHTVRLFELKRELSVEIKDNISIKIK